MRLIFVSILTVVICSFAACSDNEEDRRFGTEQVLPGTEWINISLYYGTSEAFSPIRYPKQQTLRFEVDSFTMTTQSSVYNEGQHATQDTTILTRGSYRYEHPKLWMTLETGNPTVEAWISPLNNICFYDIDDFREFKRK